MVRESGAVSVTELEARFGISSMTARRDLAELERQGIVRRTHGGAVAPGVSAHEDSFEQRVEVATDAKRALADEALTLVGPRESIFLDSSSTTYYLARRIVESGRPATILTNCLPIMDLVQTQAPEQIELIGIGGALRRLTSSFVGPSATRSIRDHYADHLFFSVKGVSRDGILTDADPLEADVKRAMIAQASSSVLLVDGSKMSELGLSAIAPVSDVNTVIAYGVDAKGIDVLSAPGVALRHAHPAS